MFTTKTRVKGLRSLLTGAALLTSTALGQAVPTSFGGYSLPQDYFNRFGSTTIVASNYTGSMGYGVRYFPLPIQPDIRLSLVKRPNYWEYGLYTRYNDTTFQVGRFDAGDTATIGVPRIELSRDPYKGTQFSAYIQDPAHVSRFSAGYATTVLNNRARLLNNVGVAFQNDVIAPYTYSELSGGYSHAVNPKFRVGFWSTARAYTFPLQRSYEASADVTPNLWLNPVDGLELTASHLERFVVGSQPVTVIPDFDLARYRESNAALSYRFKATQDFSLNMLRTRVTRDWTNERTYLYNDVLFRFNALPVLIGPTVGYQWWKDTSSNRFLFGFSTAGK